jgi:hypothetical protein
MFTTKTETAYSISDLARDLEKAAIEARGARLNLHAVEDAIEQQLRVHRQYVAASLKF